MTKPEYALYPGPVISKMDGDEHYIGAAQLAQLYGVRLSQCIVIHPEDFKKPWQRGLIARAAQLPALRPRYSGDYAGLTRGVKETS